MELYQTSIKGKGKGKKIESHSIENIEDIKTNNTLVLHTAPINEISFALVKAKSLEISYFFEDQDEKTQNLEWWQDVQT